MTQFLNFHLTTRALSATVPSMNTSTLQNTSRAFESPAHLLVTLRDMNKRAIIQWPTEGERESMDARMEAFEPIFATIEPKK